jgi:hypothetical protein
MPKFCGFLVRLRAKVGEASATVIAAADSRITPDAASTEQKPDLYSTEGSIGMKVVYDTPSARLE